MAKKLVSLKRTVLIRLVHERPALWDKTIQIYKCKQAKADAWRDICLILNEDYERLEPKHKTEYFNRVIRIWTHLRDSWRKAMKDKKESTTPYIYRDQMMFLKKVVKLNNTEQQNFVEDEEKECENASSNFSIEIQETVDSDSQTELTKKKFKINRTQLISLVRERPAIWDKTMEIYKNKNAKAEAWRDICLIMNELYDQMDQYKRKEYFKLVISIWSQIRDTWMRSVKNRFSRPYKYFDKMSFLKKIIDSADVLESIEINTDGNEHEVTIEEENESEPDDKSCSSTKSEKVDDESREYSYFVDLQKKDSSSQTEIEDRNYSFFKSIQPTLAFFNDDQILQFQAGTINLLQKIKIGQISRNFQQQEASSSMDKDPIKIETYVIS